MERHEGSPGPVSDHVPKQVAEEERDSSSPSPSGRVLLQTEDKIVMVFSQAGKPIFCCSQDGLIGEESVADVMAAAQAIVSVSKSQSGQHLRSIKSHTRKRTICFLEKPPLTLVSVSHLGEPVLILKMQLILLHAQILSLLPLSGLKTLFEKNPGYDLRRLLVGSEHVLYGIFQSYMTTPSAMLGAYPSVSMKSEARNSIDHALSAALEMTESRFGILLFKDAVVSQVVHVESSKSPGSRSVYSQKLRHWDILLLINFVMSNASSLRQATETISTLCMPFFDSHGNLFAYIRYLDSDSVCIMLSGHPIDSIALYQDAFQIVLDAWILFIEGTLGNVMVLPNTPSSEEINTEWGSIIGPYNFVYKNSRAGQYVWSQEFPEGLSAHKAIVQYGQMRAGMFALDGESANRHGPLQAFRLETYDDFIFLAFASVEAELFISIQGGVQNEHAIQFGEKLRSVLIDSSNDFFSQ